MQTVAGTFRRFNPSRKQMMAICLTLLACMGCTSETPPLSGEIEMMVKSHVAALMQSSFPELDGITIEYGPVTDGADTIFFETYVKASTSLWPARHRTYQIFANERLAEERPDDGAIRAILAHELLHIRDYLGKSFWQLLRLKQDYEDVGYQQQYERYTDQRTLKMGFGPGLARYRRWLYGVIGDPKQVKLKQRIYMTPEEIRTWIDWRQDRQEGSPEAPKTAPKAQPKAQIDGS